MDSSNISIVILTYNEEMHLQRLFKSLEGLNTPVYVLDSGSTDNTVLLAKEYGATVVYNKFENHPSQWDFALSNFNIKSKWVIGLDADQYLSDELRQLLLKFEPDELDVNIHGIYFNRKYYFKGKWIRYGGYYPKYMLKMFRTGKGKSNRSELLDHRFAVDGQTITWKDGVLIEENFKESDISFWIEKHNRYSDLVAQDEYNKRLWKDKDNNGRWMGSPDERIANMKLYWRKMPGVIRPVMYFIYRYIFLGGFLDGRVGFIFHVLQAFWFRLLVDIKIQELKEKSKE